MEVTEGVRATAITLNMPETESGNFKSQPNGVIAMQNYVVLSGPLNITIVAPTAYDAALEAVQWWGEGHLSAADADHRCNLDEQIEVRAEQRGSRLKRFPTFNLLAVSRGESPAQAWERLLQEKVGGVN